MINLASNRERSDFCCRARPAAASCSRPVAVRATAASPHRGSAPVPGVFSPGMLGPEVRAERSKADRQGASRGSALQRCAEIWTAVFEAHARPRRPSGMTIHLRSGVLVGACTDLTSSGPGAAARRSGRVSRPAHGDVQTLEDDSGEGRSLAGEHARARRRTCWAALDRQRSDVVAPSARFAIAQACRRLLSSSSPSPPSGSHWLAPCERGSASDAEDAVAERHRHHPSSL